LWDEAGLLEDIHGFRVEIVDLRENSLNIKFFKDVVGVQLHSLGSDPLSPKRLSYPKSKLHVCSEFVFATVTTDRTHEFSFEFYREVLRWIEFLVVLYPVPRIMNRVRLRVAVLEI